MPGALRKPEDRFADLPGFPFAPHHVDGLAGHAGLHLHYLDEGSGGRTFLCLHGQPTWSYLYRRMMRLIERLDLRDIVLVCQDWGGLIGLTIPMDMADRFSGLLVMNTALGTGDMPLGKGYLEWRAYSNRTHDMDCAKLLKRACPHLSDAEAAAYEAPFPEATYKAGVGRFPNLVPDHPDAGGAALSRRARDWWRTAWAGHTLMAICMQDPVLGPPVMQALHRIIRDCPAPLEIAAGGHFVQEWGGPIAEAALERFA